MFQNFATTTTKTTLRKSLYSFSRHHRLFSSQQKKNVVIVDGVRLPFSKAGTIYKDEMAVDLQRLAIKGLMTQSALDKSLVDYVISGTVIQEVRTSNIAREASINAGLPNDVGAHTVSMACISSNLAIANAAEMILADKADIIIAGGVETFSDVPIRLKRKLRQALIELPQVQKKGGLAGTLKHLSKLQLGDIFGLETPAIANYTTGEVMGISSDRLSAKFDISRIDQDEFTVRSHTLAKKAHDTGFYANQIVAYSGNSTENGIKGDSTYESVSQLKPAFVKPHGTHTAANSSFLTDGASATLIMSEEAALKNGFSPLAYLRDWSFKSCDPFEELLLGPTYCTQQIMSRNSSLNLEEDIGVFEIHEAFAGQVLSNLSAMNSQKFADTNFGGKKVGQIDIEKMNTKGGSLSIGHPFGATGARLVTNAARRLQEEQERFALVAACADGGAGHACILERYDGN